MILKKQDTKYILIESDLIQNEQEFIEKNPDYIYVEELPYSISGVYIYDKEFLPDEEADLNELKQQKLQEIEDKFNDMLNSGKFLCSKGFYVDNRRTGTKNDKDNVQSLIDLGQEPVYFKDADNNFQTLTLDDLKTIKQEMIQDGLQKYQYKWEKQQEVMEAKDINTLYEIVI